MDKYISMTSNMKEIEHGCGLFILNTIANPT
jgi:hypothetical protein